MTAADQFATLVDTMLARSAATYGNDESQGARRSFGSTSLKANGKIFVMLVKDRLVVKLPAERVDELIDQGAGERFDPGHGRPQKEWLSVQSDRNGGLDGTRHRIGSIRERTLIWRATRSTGRPLLTRRSSSTAGHYVVDSDWGEAQPSADDENRFLKSHDWAEYGAWFLGLTDGANEETKARYGFVFGDFKKFTDQGSSPATTARPSTDTKKSSSRPTVCSSTSTRSSAELPMEKGQMKAAIRDTYGPPSVVRIAEVPRPEPPADQVLVRIEAASVNWADLDNLYPRWKFLRLFLGIRAPRERRIGSDVAGVVDSVGPQVARFKPGDRVFGDLFPFGGGAFAEYVAVPEKGLALIDDAMSFEDAATLPHAAVLAVQGCGYVAADGRPGDRVLCGRSIRKCRPVCRADRQIAGSPRHRRRPRAEARLPLVDGRG